MTAGKIVAQDSRRAAWAQIVSADTFTALLIKAVASTMLTVPVVTPLLEKMEVAGRSVIG